jgi:hypothetical protein
LPAVINVHHLKCRSLCPQTPPPSPCSHQGAGSYGLTGSNKHNEHPRPISATHVRYPSTKSGSGHPYRDGRASPVRASTYHERLAEIRQNTRHRSRGPATILPLLARVHWATASPAPAKGKRATGKLKKKLVTGPKGQPLSSRLLATRRLLSGWCPACS